MEIRRGTIIILIAAFVVLIMNAAIALTPVPSFCRLCHGGEHQTWKSSTHQKVACNDCHRRPDLFGFVIQRVQVLRMVGSYLTTFYDRPVTAVVFSQSCRRCHAQVEIRTLVVKDLRISHRELKQAGFECTFCHNTVVHGQKVPQPNLISMDKCTICHNRRQAGANCESCHVTTAVRVRRNPRGPWQITHGRQWRRLHGMGDLNNCNVCHRPNFCARCHGVDLPHSDFWLNLHGKDAKTAREGCLKCHQQRLCDTCHRIKMPHPASFLPSHSEEMKKLGREKCYQCHLEQGCVRCHETHIHPGLPTDAVERLKREAGLD